MNNIISKSKLLNIRTLRTMQNITSKATLTTENKIYRSLEISEPSPSVFHVQLNRPTKLNALCDSMWTEIEECFNDLSDKAECRVVILSGAGKTFCAGIDLTDAMKLFQSLIDIPDVARKSKVLEKTIKRYQDSFTAIQQCSKPVISAVHGACIGAGVDMICSADIRYCSSDAYFQIKEVDLGMAADVGTLQRLPKIIGSQSLVNELAYTGRKMLSLEAFQIGFVSQVLSDQKSLMDKALNVATEIASKSPVAIQGIKLSLNYSKEHTIEEGLNHINMRNQVMLQSEDVFSATTALATKTKNPVFAKL